MAKPESVFIYIGTYIDKAAANDDYQVIKDLHSAGAVGTHDAAVVTKDYNGKVHVNKDEMAAHDRFIAPPPNGPPHRPDAVKQDPRRVTAMIRPPTPAAGLSRQSLE